MLTVEEALERILGRARRLPQERAPLLEAPGRVLAEDIVADIDVPPFDNTAVDGYAVRATDTQGATPETPVFLQTLADVPAGTVTQETVGRGEAAKIMTGAPVPPGADAIVMVEDTRAADVGGVAILEAARPGQHIRRAGEDVPRGSVALPAGLRIRPAEIAMLAAMGRAMVRTVRPAQVAIISTGDEIVEIVEGVPPPPGKIRDSNRYALAALVREAGAAVHSLTHIPDDPVATEAALRACADPQSGADVIVTAGGVSVGDRDFVKPALERLGRLELWKVAMKPGKPLAFGCIHDTLFFGLPGNPVSAMVTFELFVRPTLWKMAGRADADLARPQVQAVLTEDVPHMPGRREYLRAITIAQEGRFVTRPTGAQGSGILRSMTQANSLLVLPQESSGAAAGEVVTVLLLD
jgi:molybdopterin molybdotransferase